MHTNACGCKKADLHCSLLCKHCIEQSCENPIPVILDNESEEGDAPAPIDMVDEQLECEGIEFTLSTIIKNRETIEKNYDAGNRKKMKIRYLTYPEVEEMCTKMVCPMP
ncbi:hypothetical protein AVEN_92394-1 [Araneus ventricosus]|uniref:Uncharacterized protein n=1 Tax=Araneus ventricosus TaxID=182803 RepID=A0A4Y2AHR4_ARAVE|nr:hypothetical protein AVEN_92394-1 [Araneus ventricosus]